MSPKTFKLAAVTVAVIAVTGLLVQLATGPSDDPRTDVTARRPPAAAVSSNPWSVAQGPVRSSASLTRSRRALVHAFGFMRGRPERMPSRLRSHVLAVIGAPAGANLEDAQRLRSSTGDMWVVRAGRAACLVRAPKGAVACDTIEDAADRGLILGTVDAPGGAAQRFLVLGVAPDWARAVRLKVGKHARRISVDKNVYALRGKQPILLDGLERAATTS
jgi:hypothetical protein